MNKILGGISILQFFLGIFGAFFNKDKPQGRNKAENKLSDISGSQPVAFEDNFGLKQGRV